MTLSRSNYEIWLIDFLDGNLNDLQKAELLLFLDENPDIREELEAVSSVNLERPEALYPQKDLLRKSLAEIDDKHFEFLCISHLEHDLNNCQEEELLEIIENNPARKKEFDILQKIRLTPPSVNYNHKGILKRSSFRQKQVYISILSIAASIAILVSVFILIPGKPEPEPATAELITDTLSLRKIPPVQYRISNENVETKAKLNSEKISAEKTDIADITGIMKDKGNPVMPVLNIPDAGLNVNAGTDNLELIAFSPEPISPAIDENRSRIGRFLAKSYRNVFLKNEKPSDMPLKGYEIAEGGINGLNKLLGWNMAITRTTGSNGELRSVYFSSKLLKFNSPVKNQSAQ